MFPFSWSPLWPGESQGTPSVLLSVTSGTGWDLKLQGRSTSQRPTKSAVGILRTDPRSILAGWDIDVMGFAVMPLKSWLLPWSVSCSVGCYFSEQESQHEINIFYAKTTHGLRTITVIMWIPQTCDLCLSCEHVRTTVPVSSTKQMSLCVCGLCISQMAQAGAALHSYQHCPVGPVFLIDCG